VRATADEAGRPAGTMHDDDDDDASMVYLHK
jgi:hypothetical protein